MAKTPGTSFASALNVGRLNGNRAFSASLSSPDKFDFYKLSLSGRSALTGTVNRLTADADLALFDSNQKRIAFSSKPGRQAESLTAVVDAGNYFVRVQRKSGSPRYRLSLSAAVPPDGAGNSLATARSLALGATPVTLKDAIGAADTSDLYKVDVSGFSTLSLGLAELSADANVQLLSSTGVVIGSSVAGGSAPEFIKAGLATGTYFVRVLPGSGAATNYELNLALNPLKLVGLTDSNQLVSFSPGSSTAATSVGVSGLESGENLLGIDYRPATGQLFGLGSSNRLYTLDAATGVATRLGTAAIAPALSGSSFGFDFNPVPDRIRVVSDTEQNLRLNPETGGIAGVDTPLSPVGNGVASAYTNNRAGVTSTTLLNIDSVSDQLVRQGGINGSPSPNAGSITAIGSLNVDFGATGGFDIFTDGIGNDFGFAASGSTLYSINLVTGAATTLGSVGSTPINLIGLAAKA